jgi:hypothetical protein
LIAEKNKSKNLSLQTIFYLKRKIIHIASIQLFISLVVMTLLGLSVVKAQTPKKTPIDLDAFVQQLVGQQTEDINYEDAYESLLQLYTNPLDLNHCTKADLQSLFILSEYQIKNFFDYRDKNGKFLTLYELQAIEGFDRMTFEALLPFVEVRDVGLTIDGTSILHRMWHDKDNRFLLLRYENVLQQRKGYSQAVPNSRGELPTRYLGDPSRLYGRFRSSHTNDYSYGFTVEKDAGEQLAWNPEKKQYGMDFYSYHITVYNRGRFKTITAGDYVIQVGQSLLLAGGFQTGKGADPTTTVRRGTRGIIPYTSLVESGFFRGGAFTYEVNKQIDFTGFYSNFNYDATLRSTANVSDSLQMNDGSADTEQLAGTLRQLGFHRTTSELAAKGTINEQVIGGNLTYRSKSKNFTVGTTAINAQYDIPLQRVPREYNQFEFQGKNNLLLGVDYTYNWNNFSFFGEGGRSESGGIGVINGIVASLSKTVEFSTLYRKYERNFHSFFGQAIGENSRNINEEGIYWGIKIKPNRQWQLAAYYDQFIFPWARFRADAPTAGDEWLGRITYSPSKTVTMYAQYREELKPRNQAGNVEKIDFVTPTTRANYIFNIDVKTSPTVMLRSRVQGSQFSQANTTYGFAVMQDVNFDFAKFDVATRFCLFDADDFDNRQFMYEKDVLYAFAIPTFYGRGMRAYVVLRLKATRKLDFWFKYGYTRYDNRNTIGSGLEEINGNIREDIRTQMRIKF